MKMLRLAVFVVGAFLLNISGSLCQLDVCGQAPLKPRIIGGQNALRGSWPWFVSIHYTSTGDLLCGGSLINQEWVLSAAQCFQGTSAQRLVIHLGRYLQTDPDVIYRPVKQIIVHPKYDSKKFNNDIALLQLESPVPFSDLIRPVCLAASGSSIGKGAQSWITGWGSLDSAGIVFPTVLQEVNVPVVNNKDCKSAYGSSITDNMICAGLTGGGKDSCIGDAGGPMVHNSSKWIQSGIASFGIGCAQPKYPGVYTRVSEYQSWINSHISRDQPGFIKFKSSGFRSSSSLSVFSLSLMFSIIPLIFSLFC